MYRHFDKNMFDSWVGIVHLSADTMMEMMTKLKVPYGISRHTTDPCGSGQFV